MNRKKSMAYILERYIAWKSCKYIYCPFKMWEHHITYVKWDCLSVCITFPSLSPNIFKCKMQSFYKCFNTTGPFFLSDQWREIHNTVQRSYCICCMPQKVVQRHQSCRHNSDFFSSSNCMKNIINRCSHLNFLANWIYCLKFSSVWLPIQRQTLAAQSWKR